MNLLEIDSNLVDAVSLANAFNYSIANDISYITTYLNDNDISIGTIDFYIELLHDIIDDMANRDFDLQYSDTVIDNFVLQPQSKKDTVLTLSIIDSVYSLKPGVKYSESDIFLLLQQTAVNGIKYQCKYALTSLQQLLHLLKIIDEAETRMRMENN